MQKKRKLSYWEKRAVNQEEYIFRGLAPKEQKVTKAYLKAQDYLTSEVKKIYDRYLNKSGMSEDDVGKVLNTTVQPSDLVELQRLSKSITDKDVKKQVQAHLNGLAVKSRISRLEDLKAKSFLVSKQVADVQLETSTDYYIDVIRDAYNQSAAEGIIGQTDKLLKKDFKIHNWQDGPVKFQGNQALANYSIKNNKPVVEIYDWQKQKVIKTIGLTSDAPVVEFKQLSTKYVNNILDSNWKGSNYSKRIWSDTDKLAKRLEELLTVEAMTGRSEREMTKAIANEFNQSIGIARRLIRTEANYVAGQAKLKGWKSHGVKQYVIVAVLDLRTSLICQGKDGKIYNVDEAICDGSNGNYPPFHPWCRTVVRAYFGKQTLQGERIANDPLSGDTFKIKQSDSYKKWEQILINKHGQDDYDRFKRMTKNHKTDFTQYQKYQAVIGVENMTETFEKFQEMKYNDGTEWKALQQVYKDKRLQEKILNGTYNLKIHEGKQGKHILGHNNYVEGKSYILDTINPQELVDKYAGKGKLERSLIGKWRNKEQIVQDEYIGVNSSLDGKLPYTNKFTIHYSKTGTHIVPTLKGEDEK